MNALDAFRAMVHNYPGGAEPLAIRMGISATTLRHEVDPNYPSAKLGVARAIELTQITGSLHGLNAMCIECGCFPPMPIPAGDSGDASVAEVMRRMGIVAKEFSDMFAELNADLADGIITPNEMTQIESESRDTIGAIASLLAELRQKVDSDAHAATKKVRA